MRRRELDLFLVAACSLLLALVLLAFPSAEPARAVLGVPFLLLFPGYTLLAALFPRRRDLDGSERAALSLGLSIAIVVLIGLGLNYSPWGFRLNSIFAFVALFILLAVSAAAYRRRSLPAAQAYGATVDFRWPRWPRIRPVDVVMSAGLVLSLAGLGLAVHFVASSEGSSERFTEFYALEERGNAGSYPVLLTVGEEARVVLGVVNREGEEAAYRINVGLGGESTSGVNSVLLRDGERWEKAMSLVPTRPGRRQKVEFLLYREGGREPYRSLHLWLDVQSARSGAAAAPPAPASAEPPATLGETAAPSPPQFRVHVVSSGENLTFIAKQYGVPLSEVIAANELENPSLIYPLQEIRIPPGGTAEGQ